MKSISVFNLQREANNIKAFVRPAPQNQFDFSIYIYFPTCEPFVKYRI
jgi:hypothetical protein